MDLQQKKASLQKLKEKLSLQKKKKQEIQHELINKTRKKRTLQLINAGLLFEKVGILEKYTSDIEFILGLLYSASDIYNNQVLKTKYQIIGKQLLNKNMGEIGHE